jgi:hypothetical protein
MSLMYRAFGAATRYGSPINSGKKQNPRLQILEL